MPEEKIDTGYEYPPILGVGTETFIGERGELVREGEELQLINTQGPLETYRTTDENELKRLVRIRKGDPRFKKLTDKDSQ